MRAMKQDRNKKQLTKKVEVVAAEAKWAATEEVETETEHPTIVAQELEQEWIRCKTIAEEREDFKKHAHVESYTHDANCVLVQTMHELDE